MSNALAIASVTAILKDLLDNAMIDHSLSTFVNDNVTVTALQPDRIKIGDDEKPQLNLFLYDVAPNPGWRNAGLPSRDERGERLTNQPLALDLYYLLTAYGKKDFDTEILLGYALQMVHETSVLSRDAIRKALASVSPFSGSILPPSMKGLSTSDLAEQVELIKITPHQISTEEKSKLWSAFQAHYRTSVAYHVSVVLIESKYQARSPLPVLTRGVISQPDLMPAFPALEEANPPNGQPAVRMGEILTLVGRHLNGNKVAVRFKHVRSSQIQELLASTGLSPDRFQVVIPPDPNSTYTRDDDPLNPDNWQAGIYSVIGVVQPAGQQAYRTTNELPLALAPRIESISAAEAGGIVTVTVNCSPKVWMTQQATMVIGDCEVASEPITEEKTDQLFFKSSDLPSGAQWVRLRVDGIDSILVNKSGSLPAFDTSQKVPIP